MKIVIDAAVRIVMASMTLGFLEGCSSGGGRCNTDSCYRNLASQVDAFEEGDVVAWGVTEKQAKDEAKQKRRELASEKARSK